MFTQNHKLKAIDISQKFHIEPEKVIGFYKKHIEGGRTDFDENLNINCQNCENCCCCVGCSCCNDCTFCICCNWCNNCHDCTEYENRCDEW